MEKFKGIAVRRKPLNSSTAQSPVHTHSNNSKNLRSPLRSTSNLNSNHPISNPPSVSSLPYKPTSANIFTFRDSSASANGITASASVNDVSVNDVSVNDVSTNQSCLSLNHTHQPMMISYKPPSILVSTNSALDHILAPSSTDGICSNNGSNDKNDINNDNDDNNDNNNCRNIVNNDDNRNNKNKNKNSDDINHDRNSDDNNCSVTTNDDSGSTNFKQENSPSTFSPDDSLSNLDNDEINCTDNQNQEFDDNLHTFDGSKNDSMVKKMIKSLDLSISNKICISSNSNSNSSNKSINSINKKSVNYNSNNNNNNNNNSNIRDNKSNNKLLNIPIDQRQPLITTQTHINANAKTETNITSSINLSSEPPTDLNATTDSAQVQGPSSTSSSLLKEIFGLSSS